MFLVLVLMTGVVCSEYVHGIVCLGLGVQYMVCSEYVHDVVWIGTRNAHLHTELCTLPHVDSVMQQ